MKIVSIIVRTLLGLMFLFASVTYLFKLMPQPPVQGTIKTYNDGLGLVHLMPIVKIIELLCGLAFITGRFVTLATVVIFPVLINIVLFHAYLGPSELPLVIVLLLGDLFLAYYYRNNYRTLFAAK